jgi:hypothetical protein
MPNSCEDVEKMDHSHIASEKVTQVTLENIL